MEVEGKMNVATTRTPCPVGSCFRRSSSAGATRALQSFRVKLTTLLVDRRKPLKPGIHEIQAHSEAINLQDRADLYCCVKTSLYVVYPMRGIRSKRKERFQQAKVAVNAVGYGG